VVYLRLSTKHDRIVHAVILIDIPYVIWTEVVERYGITTDILIDSHKGMGGWFDDTQLYSVMKNTSMSYLLPSYYFKGKYISRDAPEGFNKLYIIPEAEGQHWCECGIYKT